MNFLAALSLLLVLPLLVFAAARLCSGRKWSTIVGGFGVLAATLSIGAWMLSRPATATVTGKTEYFELSMRGIEPRATRHLLLTVAGAELGSMRFNVERRIYDTYRVGEPAPLHVVSFGPLKFGRLDAEPWWNLLPGRFEERLPMTRPDAFESAQAMIDSVRTVRDAYVLPWAALLSQTRDVAHITLPQPYDEVQFHFSTPRGADIVALDRVDSGSAGVLAAGMAVRVNYPSTDPHRAQLALGMRNHAARNVRGYWSGQILLAVGVMVLIVGALSIRRLTRGRDPAPVSGRR